MHLEAEPATLFELDQQFRKYWQRAGVKLETED